MDDKGQPEAESRPQSGLTAALVAFVVLLSLGLTLWRDTMAPPAVRNLTVALRGMAAGSPPVTIALLSDFHVAEPNMSPARLAGIVERVNGLHPDVVLLAGDFVSDPGFGITPYGPRDAIAPLAGLRAPLGVYAVLGNHDRWNAQAAVQRALGQAGIVVLRNETRRIGPLALGGLDGEIIKPKRLTRMLAALNNLGGGKVFLSHSPDDFALLPAGSGMMLAGHTHCGQIRLFGWSPVTNSRHGQRYACGVVQERGNLLVVTAGLGTSVVPFRLGAEADLWLITVRPPQGLRFHRGRKKAAERQGPTASFSVR